MNNEQLRDLVAETLLMTIRKLDASPSYQVYLHAREQLEMIAANLASENTLKTTIDPAAIDIGFMAARELESSDPGYADNLERIDFYYKRNAKQPR